VTTTAFINTLWNHQHCRNNNRGPGGGRIHSLAFQSRQKQKPPPYGKLFRDPMMHHHHSRRFSTLNPNDDEDNDAEEQRAVPSPAEDDAFFATSIDFDNLGIESEVLLTRIRDNLRLERPTAVQAATFAQIRTGRNVTVGAETGSGKTLAYLLPLMDDILQLKKMHGAMNVPYDYGRALILVPNKELVQQVVRMAMGIAGGKASLVYGSTNLQPETFSDLSIQRHSGKVPNEELIRIAVFPGELKSPLDFPPFRKTRGLTSIGTEPPVDLVISTPAAVGPLALSPKNINLFADIQTLVIDEADMLLDGAYIRALENVFMGFRRADRLDPELAGNAIQKTQHVFVAATLPDFGLRSVDAYLKKKFPHAIRVTMTGMHNARHYGLKEKTAWIELEDKKERMVQLVEMLQTLPSENQHPDGIGLKGQKVMVFLNTVEDVEKVSEALSQVGLKVSTYHAKMNMADRTKALARFRKYKSSKSNDGDDDDKSNTNMDDDTVPILVCTDMASRGLDIPAVDAVVQLQFAGNVVAHLHRMGRCGRAGLRNGRGIVFYGEQQKHLVKVIQEAEKQQERMVLEGDVLDLEEQDALNVGTVKKAFSRRRGFTQKRKKREREAASQSE
jgi:superfamily II DNA/RNA helicase